MPSGARCPPDRRNLPKGVRVKRVLLNREPAQAEAIVFTPDGVSMPYAVELRDEDNRGALVELGVWFDEVTTARIGET